MQRIKWACLVPLLAHSVACARAQALLREVCQELGVTITGSSTFAEWSAALQDAVAAGGVQREGGEAEGGEGADAALPRAPSSAAASKLSKVDEATR